MNIPAPDKRGGGATHPTEEDLILHCYGEADQGAAIDSHLSACADCRAEFEELRRLLSNVQAEAVPPRGESYPSAVWARLRPRLRAEPRRTVVLRPRAWAAMGAIAASLVVGFFVGRGSQPPPARQALPISEKARDRILLVNVGELLDRSQMLLVEVVNAEGEDAVDISEEQQWAKALAGDSRLYRLTAQRAGNTSMAAVLDELEQVLLEIANGPSSLSAQELSDVRQRIEGKEILFKVRVLGTQVRVREKESAPERAGKV